MQNGPAPAPDKGYALPRAKAAYALLFLFLAFVAFQCARLGVAGLYQQTGEYELYRWTRASNTPGMAEIERIRNYFATSLEYSADNPWALERIGTLDLARMRVSRDSAQALSVTRHARTQFRLALQQRPTSPYLWSNLALTKLYLDEIDGELMAALRHADELGPWEPAVQQNVLFVGLAVWNDLDDGLRQTMSRTLRRGAARNSVKMFEIAKSYTRLDLVCAIEEYRAVAGQNCRKTENSESPGALLNQGQRR